MTQSGFLEVPGGSLYFETTGAGNPLVLIHAGVANLGMWDPQVESLAKRYRVIRYDTRGYGRTESEHVPFSNRADLAALLDHLDVSTTYLLGASRGGIIALDFTLERPDRVTALIIAAGGISGYAPDATEGEEQMWEEVEQMWEEHRWEELADFETRWWVDGPGQPPDRVDTALRARVHDWILSNYQAEKEDGIPQPLDPPATARLHEVSIPTLVMVGDLDDEGTQDSCRRLAREVEGARLEVFPSAAHMINLEQPARFTNLLMRFLADVESAA